MRLSQCACATADVGSVFTGDVYDPNNRCSLASPPASVTIYNVGDEIPPATFAEGVPQLLGDAHVSATVSAVAGHSVPLLAGTHDTSLNVACSIMLAADGKRRCLPSSGAAAYFTDDQCKDVVFAEAPSSFCGPPASPYGVAPDGSAACAAEPTWHAYHLGATIPTPATLFQKNPGDGSCVATGPGAYSIWNAPGDEIPAASLAETTTVP